MDINSMIQKIIDEDRPCALYEAGEPFWTDPYISGHLLQTHLDDSTDLASYKPERRVRTAGNIIRSCLLSAGSRVLDLGCGPGLYSALFAEHGIQYTGVDISGRSLDYAAAHRGRHESLVAYRQLDYTNLDYKDEFDACFMIWCDFGVLSPDHRAKLLAGAYSALKPGGRLAFDVYSPEGPDQMQPGSSWQACNGGFWDPGFHLVLERVEYFVQHHLRVQQCIVAAGGSVKTYRIWDKRYEKEEISGILAQAGFCDIECIDGGLSGEQLGVWGIFCSKKR